MWALGLYKSVVLVLFLLRQNPVQQAAAELFHISQATVSRRWTTLLPVVETALAEHVPDPADASHGRIVLVDGTAVRSGRRRPGTVGRCRHGGSPQVAGVAGALGYRGSVRVCRCQGCRCQVGGSSDVVPGGEAAVHHCSAGRTPSTGGAGPVVAGAALRQPWVAPLLHGAACACGWRFRAPCLRAGSRPCQVCRVRVTLFLAWAVT
ncbi:transposase family protein [Streptomyces sp. V4I8]|uniref:helix-turn-helix domain-containing protein n=1 Tax=Streptomyces sp. V4I8 TaxID=3156469 RepID=UPI003518254C